MFDTLTPEELRTLASKLTSASVKHRGAFNRKVNRDFLDEVIAIRVELRNLPNWKVLDEIPGAISNNFRRAYTAPVSDEKQKIKDAIKEFPKWYWYPLHGGGACRNYNEGNRANRAIGMVVWSSDLNK